MYSTNQKGGETMTLITKIESNNRARTQKTKVAAYVRVSTDTTDQLFSLENQKDHYENLIRSNSSWEFAGLYVDEGISGTKMDKRDSLKQLLDDCEKGKIHRVITKSISRLARNTVDCLEIVRKLGDLGVFIYFEKENIDTEHMSSELMLSILSAIAESESVSISENNKWSIKRRFENGSFIVAYPPYGYQNLNSKWVINPDEVNVARDIFDMALNGLGSYLIADKLNEKGIKPRKARKWNHGTINGMLKNLNYTGDLILQKTYTDSSFNRVVNTGEKDMYLIKDHHEPIISHEEFDLIQDLIEFRAKEKGNVNAGDKYQNRYPFSGIIFCGNCGGKFMRRTHYKANESYTAWTCYTHLHEKEKCNRKYSTQEDIENAFTILMNKLRISVDEILKPFLESIKMDHNSDRFSESRQIDEKLEKLKESQVDLSKLLASGYISMEDFHLESLNTRQELEELEKRKAILKSEVTGNIHHINEATKLIKYLSKEEYLKGFDEKTFSEYVESITAQDRKCFIFHLKCGLNLKQEVK